jgi:hypothetical protein
VLGQGAGSSIGRHGLVADRVRERGLANFARDGCLAFAVDAVAIGPINPIPRIDHSKDEAVAIFVAAFGLQERGRLFLFSSLVIVLSGWRRLLAVGQTVRHEVF